MITTIITTIIRVIITIIRTLIKVAIQVAKVVIRTAIKVVKFVGKVVKTILKAAIKAYKKCIKTIAKKAKRHSAKLAKDRVKSYLEDEAHLENNDNAICELFGNLDMVYQGSEDSVEDCSEKSFDFPIKGALAFGVLLGVGFGTANASSIPSFPTPRRRGNNAKNNDANSTATEYELEDTDEIKYSRTNSGRVRGAGNSINNILNIRYNTSVNWEGSTGFREFYRGDRSVGRFVGFSDAAYSFRAASHLERSYRNRNNGKLTLRQYIYKFAPPEDENNTSSYLTKVASHANMDPDAELDFANNKSQFIKVMQSQAMIENSTSVSEEYLGRVWEWIYTHDSDPSMIPLQHANGVVRVQYVSSIEIPQVDTQVGGELSSDISTSTDESSSTNSTSLIESVASTELPPTDSISSEDLPDTQNVPMSWNTSNIFEYNIVNSTSILSIPHNS